MSKKNGRNKTRGERLSEVSRLQASDRSIRRRLAVLQNELDQINASGTDSGVKSKRPETDGRLLFTPMSASDDDPFYLAVPEDAL